MRFSINKKRLQDPVVFFFSFIILLIIAMNLNFHGGKMNMGGEIWSDKAGYYVYLPATFIYHFDAAEFPENIDSETGNGFSLNQESHKVLTKYTCAVSILVAPFFLATHLIASVFDLKPDGFSMIYHGMAVVAGVFYLTLGLFFLKKTLDNYFRPWISYITIFFFFTATNLYFYGLDDILMSHVYSFFLFSLLLFLLRRFYNESGRKHIHFIFLSIVAFMLILNRPTNIILLLIVLFFDARSFEDAWKRFSLFMKPRYLITLFIIGFLVFLPQMLYWKYAFGSFIHYSYVGEGFINWLHPMIIEIWFSPINGLFLYNPILIFMIVGIFMMIIKRIPNGIFILVFFLFISYLFSSWGVWYYGGCYGSRPFVDFYPLLIIPFGFLVDSVYSHKNLILKILFTALVVLFSFANIKMIYKYVCFTGSTWAWDDFLKTLDRAGLYNLERSSYTFKNDFENITVNDGILKTGTKWHSRTTSTYMMENMPINCNYTWRVDNIIRHKIIKTVNASVWVNPKFFDKIGALLIFRITDNDENLLFSKIIRTDDQVTRNNQWTEIKGTFEVPANVDPVNFFSFYIWNIREKRFYIDDLELKFN
jgi:hypothetical protein